MSSKKVNTEDLAQTILSTLSDYVEGTEEEIAEELKQIATETKTKLKSIKQPQATETGTANQISRRDWNNYSKGWSIKTKKDKTTKKPLGYYVYNSKKPNLTYLLEKGHATRNGGRTRAFKHIEPIRDEVEKEITERVEDAIKRVKTKAK